MLPLERLVVSLGTRGVRRAGGGGPARRFGLAEEAGLDGWSSSPSSFSLLFRSVVRRDLVVLMLWLRLRGSTWEIPSGSPIRSLGGSCMNGRRIERPLRIAAEAVR